MIIRPAVLGLPVFYGLLFHCGASKIRLKHMGGAQVVGLSGRNAQKNARCLGLHSSADGINIYVGL